MALFEGTSLGLDDLELNPAGAVVHVDGKPVATVARDGPISAPN